MPVLLEIGLNQLGLGEPQRALASLEEARRLEAGFTPAVTPLRADILVGLGRARLALGDATAALEVLQQADDFWLEFDARNRWAGEAAYWLGASQRALGHSGEANAAFARAAKILVTSPIAADATLVAAATAQSREGSVR
jgi:tetratricopeptide (TPR) repeat protein